MNKILRYSFVALLAMIVGNIYADSYKLEKVTSVTDGGLYVFEQGGHVMGSTIASSALQTVTDYKTTGLEGTEAYVWKLESTTGGFYMKNNSLSSNEYLKNASGTAVSFVASDATPSVWAFNFQDDETVLIQNTNNSDRYLGYTNATSYAYKAYATSSMTYSHAVVVYQLVSASDPRTSTTINFSEGYETKVSSGLTSKVSLPTATVKAGENTVEGAPITWNLTIQRWSETEVEDQPSIIKEESKVKIPNGTFGVVTLKAEYAGNETYQSSSKSYTLTVYRAETTIGLIYENIIKHMDRYDNGNATELSYWPVNLDEHEKVTIREEKVTYIDGRNVYITDGSQGMVLYFANTDEITNLGLKVGSKIKLDESKIVDGQPVGLTNADGIYGKAKFYYGVPELALDNGGFGSNVKIADGDVPSPKEITIDKIQKLIGILSIINGNEGKPTPDLQNNFSANVFINNYVTIKDAEYVGQGSSTSIHKFKIEEQEFTVSKYKASLSDALVSGAKYTLTGIGTLYKSSNKFSEGELDPQLKLTTEPVKTAEPTGINTIKTDADVNAPAYNLAGQKVDKSYKGVVIMNGKKMIQK